MRISPSLLPDTQVIERTLVVAVRVCVGLSILNLCTCSHNVCWSFTVTVYTPAANPDILNLLFVPANIGDGFIVPPDGVTDT